MFKKSLSFVIAMIIVVSAILCVSVSAEDLDTPVNNDITVYYLYTNSVSSALSISSKTATCKSTVIGKSGITTKIVITQYLQKKSGTSWTNYASWTKTFNQVSAVFTNSKSSLSSGTYRTRTVAKIYDGTKYETANAFSVTAIC